MIEGLVKKKTDIHLDGEETLHANNLDLRKEIKDICSKQLPSLSEKKKFSMADLIGRLC